MKVNNPYFGKPYTELEEIYYEHILLSKKALFSENNQEYIRINREISLIQDALAAYVRGSN